MELDIEIEAMREKLNRAINVKGISHKQTIKVSQQLDRLVIIQMRRMVA